MSPLLLVEGSIDEDAAVNRGSIGVLLLDVVLDASMEGVLGLGLDFFGFDDLEFDRDGLSFLTFAEFFRLLALFVDHGRCVRIFCIKNDLGVFSVAMFPAREEFTNKNCSWDILGL